VAREPERASAMRLPFNCPSSVEARPEFMNRKLFLRSISFASLLLAPAFAQAKDNAIEKTP
jgi:hypothetical protein